MKYAKGLYLGIKHTFNPSKKDSSGIMDVIVVERPDGTLSSSTFFVHFGMFELLDTTDKIVDIINKGVYTGISMKLDTNGIARFFRKNQPPVIQEPSTTVEINEKLIESAIIEDNRDLIDPDEVSDKRCRSLPDPGSYQSELLEARLTGVREPLKDLEKNLTSDELKQLRLQIGLNILHFVIREDFKVYLPCKVYFWPNNTKIIISDIDGTLTKSDLMGHIFYMIGKDWTRGGAVYFFNILHDRGYKVLYLSARSLSQIDSTRNYLANIIQDGRGLPDGPLMLNSCGLVRALVSEMAKKSKVFKENILSEVKGLFEKGKMPFVSGVGNRSGDAVAYAAIGIPNDRIFIINKKGKEKGDFVSIRNFKDHQLQIDVYFPDANA